MQRLGKDQTRFPLTAATVYAPDRGAGGAAPLEQVDPERIDETSGAQLTADEYHAWRGFLRAHQALFRALDDEIQEESGIPFVQYDVLVQLHNAGGRLRMRDLAGRLLVSRSGATRLIDRMETEGYVTRERCSQDGRGQFAVLTAKGLGTLDDARPAHLRAVRRRFLSQLNDQQLLAIGAGFTRVLRELERETGESLL